MKFLLGICCVLWSLYKCVGSDTSVSDHDSNKTLLDSIDQKAAVTLSGIDRCLLDATMEYVKKVPQDADLSSQKTVQAWCVVVTRHSDCVWKYGMNYDAESEMVLNASILNTETWVDHQGKCPRSHCMCIDRVAEDYTRGAISITKTNPNNKEKLNSEGCTLINEMRNCVINYPNCGPDYFIPSFKIVELWVRRIKLFDGKYDKMSVEHAYNEYCRGQYVVPGEVKYKWIPIEVTCINCKIKGDYMHGQVAGPVRHQHEHSTTESQWNAKNILLVGVLSVVVLALATFLLYILYQIAQYDDNQESCGTV